MKVVAFNGSARKKSNTSILIDIVLDVLKREDIETEVVNLAGKKIRGCTACMQCFGKRDQTCSGVDDFINDCIAKMTQADGMILASPTYFANVSTEMKALIDRAGMVSFANPGLDAPQSGRGHHRCSAYRSFPSLHGDEHVFYLF